MDGKSYVGNASRVSESVAAAVRRPPGADRSSADSSVSTRPAGTNYGTSGGSRITALSVPNFVVRRSKHLAENNAVVAKSEVPERKPRIDAVAANGVYEQSIKKIATVMDNVEQKTFYSSAKMLLDELVNVEAENPTGFWRVMDYVVKKAIAEPIRSSLYAHLCSEAYRKSLVDARDEVRTSFCELFKRELIKACNNVLRAAGILNSMRPNGLEARFGTKAKRVDSRDLSQFDQLGTLGACRFLGELYMANTLKIFNVVRTNIETFMRARDAHSLECLSMLLMVIGPKFDKVRESETECTAKKIYTELRKMASWGHANKTLPPRTIEMINRLLSMPGKIDDQTETRVISNRVGENNIVTDYSTRVKTSTALESVGRPIEAPAMLPATTSRKTTVDNLIGTVKTSETGSASVREKHELNKRNTDESSSMVRRPEVPAKDTTAAAVPKTGQDKYAASTSSVQNTKHNDTITSNKLLIQSVDAVIRNLTQDTVSESSRVLLDILVKANETNHSMNHIVQKAIDNPTKSHLYARLCAEVKNNASEDSRGSVQTRFTDDFRTGLIRSCNRVLSEAGIENHARPRRPEETTRILKDVDATTRVRTLETCRFMGHLFTTKVFKMYSIVTRTVNALLKRRDEHSLECLCALLMIIGPRYEQVENTSVLSSAKKVYEELKRLAVTGYEENTLSLRIIQIINRLLRLRDDNWASRKPSFPQELIEKYHTSFVRNFKQKTRYRELLVNTEGPVRNGGQQR